MNTRRAKPFPWGCAHCGARTVRPITEDYVTKVNHEGKIYGIRVPNAVVPCCSQCGRKVLTQSLSGRIYAALREKLGLLQPEDIKAGIEALGLSQKDVASRLGVAQETMSRWITGAMIQTRSNDRFLRVFFHVPAARRILKEQMDAITSAK